MSNFLDKVQVNTAITDNTKLDLGHQHITTLDFMELQPSMYKEMVPGETLKVNMESFARLNPLPVPSYGRAHINSRAFFVPYRTVFPGWTDFITDSVHVPSTITSGSGLISTVPTVDNTALCNAFLSYSAGSVQIDDPVAYETAMASDSMVFTPTPSVPGTDVPFDIAAAGAGNTYTYYTFTTRGRQAFKVLESLGYKVIWNTMKSADTGYINPVYSALPLLCLTRIWCEYYFPNQYTNATVYDDLVSLCKRDNTITPLELLYSDVFLILSRCAYVQYDADMFTAAFDRPNSPSSGTVSSDFRLINIDNVGQEIGRNFASATNYLGTDVKGFVTNNSGAATINTPIGGTDAPFITPYVARGTNGTNTLGTMATPISQYLLHSLHALSDYLKRNQISGSKAVDRYLSRFGKSLSAEKLNRPIYIGGHQQDIQIGDIMSTADTEGSNLGAYAGKGMSYGNGQFEFSTDEYGMFIILTSLVPNTGYWQGIDRTVKHISKLDYWTPEFDSLGAAAVGADELYVPDVYNDAYAGLDQQVFGYLPTYYEMKAKNDKLTGNFRLASINGSIPGIPAEFNAANSWHLMRTFDNTDYDAAATIVHGPGFIFGYDDMSQYKRIFYDVKASSPDNFTIIHNFDVASYAPMHSLFDSYDFEDKGKKITEDVNGIRMN